MNGLGAIDSNSMPQVVEVKLRLRPCTIISEAKDVVADLRVNRGEIDCPEGNLITVELKRVFLGLELTGLDTVPKTRLGEPIKEIKIVEKQSTTVKQTAEGKLTGQVGIDIKHLVEANFKLNAGGSVEAKATTTNTAKVDITQYRVKARGDDTWEVSEPEQKANRGSSVLDGTYLADDCLCKILPQSGSNMRGVELSAYAKQRDLSLKLSKNSLKQRFLNYNQERLFGILVAQSFGLVGPKYAGIVRLSMSEVILED